jgi:hypothetical protein
MSFCALASCHWLAARHKPDLRRNALRSRFFCSFLLMPEGLPCEHGLAGPEPAMRNGTRATWHVDLHQSDSGEDV